MLSSLILYRTHVVITPSVTLQPQVVNRKCWEFAWLEDIEGLFLSLSQLPWKVESDVVGLWSNFRYSLEYGTCIDNEPNIMLNITKHSFLVWFSFIIFKSLAFQPAAAHQLSLLTASLLFGHRVAAKDCRWTVTVQQSRRRNSHHCSHTAGSPSDSSHSQAAAPHYQWDT